MFFNNGFQVFQRFTMSLGSSFVLMLELFTASSFSWINGNHKMIFFQKKSAAEMNRQHPNDKF
jgi:hypothetical protein